MSEPQEKSRCPLCGGAETGPAFRFPELSIFRCRECGHHWQWPFPEPGVLDAIFRGLYRGDSEVIERYFPEWRVFYKKDRRGMETADCRGAIRRRLQLAERFVKPGKVLDIGCGFGGFLALARERGWEGHGVEPSGPAADYVRRELDLPVSDSLPADLSPYRLLTLWDVLEHQRDPAGFLENISAAAGRGSLLAVAVPARQSLPIRLLEMVFRVSRGRLDAGLSRFYVITHLHYFNQAGLARLLEGAGYRLLLSTRENTCLQQLELKPMLKISLRLLLGAMRILGSGNRLLVYGVKI